MSDGNFDKTTVLFKKKLLFQPNGNSILES